MQLGGKRRPHVLCNVITLAYKLGTKVPPAQQHALFKTLEGNTKAGLSVLDVADLIEVCDCSPCIFALGKLAAPQKPGSFRYLLPG